VINIPLEEFTPAGQSQNPDYASYVYDDSGPPKNYRWPTLPPGDDGSIDKQWIDTVTPA
jgi:hypothetical protein